MRDSPSYQPAKIWTWNKPNDGQFANINRPVAGPTNDKVLPVGRHPLQLYSLATPNGLAPSLSTSLKSSMPSCQPSLRSVPNACHGYSGKWAARLTLAADSGTFTPTRLPKIEYAIDHFAMETKRQLDVFDQRLAQSEYLAGENYTIADIAVWPWCGALAKGLLYEAGEFLQVQEYKNVQRWTEQIAQRPAVKRGRMVNRTRGEASSQLHERHEASDFESTTQDKATATDQR